MTHLNRRSVVWRCTGRVLVLAILLCCVSHAHAQSNARNAAVLYQMAFDRTTDDLLTEEQWTLISEAREPVNQPPSEALRAAIRKAMPAIELGSRAARMPRSDFQLQYDEGFELMLPHLSRFRQLARLMSADAVVRVQDGDHDGAANRIADLYRMAGHITDDRLLIASLVGQAVFKLAESTADFAYERKAFNPAHSSMVLGGVQQLTGNDPFNTLESLMMEQEIAFEWVSKRFAEDGHPGAIAEAAAGEPATAQMLSEIDSAEALDQELEKYDAAMSMVIEAFALDDRQASADQLAALEKDVAGGDYGVLAQVILPAMGKILQTTHANEDLVKNRVDLLTRHLEGAVVEADLANAAHWYLRAIEQWNALPSEHRVRIALHADVVEDPVDDALRAALLAATDLVATLNEAAAIRRCDFTKLSDRQALGLAPHYAPGMRDLGRLLIASARASLAGGTIETGVDQLELAFVLCAHLSMDDMLLSSLVADRVHECAMVLAGDAIKAGLLEPEHRRRLATAHERLARTDPFGWIQSVAAQRDRVAHWLKRSSPHAVDGKEAWPAGEPEASIEVIRRYDADRLMTLLAVFDTMTRSSAGIDPEAQAGHAQSSTDGSSTKRDEFEPLIDERFSREWLEAARLSTATLAPLLHAADMQAIAAAPLPENTPFTERMRGARNELRKAASILLPEGRTTGSAGAQQPAEP